MVTLSCRERCEAARLAEARAALQAARRLQFGHGLRPHFVRAPRPAGPGLERRAGGGVAADRDRARAPAQQRQRPPVPPRQLVPLPDRLRRARRVAGACTRAAQPRCCAAPRTPRREIWDGLPRSASDAAPAALGVDAAFDAAALDAVMADAAREPERRSGSRSARDPGARAPRRQAGSPALRARARSGVEARPCKRDLAPLLAEMRLRKDAGRTRDDAPRRADQRRRACARDALLRRALSRRAERQRARVRDRGRAAARVPPPRLAKPGLHQSIVAAGANACVLHYAAADAELRAGELCLIDAGCELDGYASDITRTFPANGRFTRAQRELYDIVLAAQQAAVDGHPARRAPARRAPRGGARAHARHARHRPARPQHGRRRRRGDRSRGLSPVLHARHRPLARARRARCRRVPGARRSTGRAARRRGPARRR